MKRISSDEGVSCSEAQEYYTYVLAELSEVSGQTMGSWRQVAKDGRLRHVQKPPRQP